MAIQVLEDLKQLQQELEKLSSAVSYIDRASEVAKTSEEINDRFLEFSSDISELEKEHREKLIEQHDNHISDFSTKVNDFLKENNKQKEVLSKLMGELNELEKSITEYYLRIEEINFPQRLDKIDNQISSIHLGIGNLQSSVQFFQTKMDEITKELTSVRLQNRVMGIFSIIVLVLILGGIVYLIFR